MFKIVLDDRAEEDLDSIYFYIAENESIQRADKVITTILAAIEKISKHPYSYPKNADYIGNKKIIRNLIVNISYKIVYEVFEEFILIARVHHNSRNPDNILTNTD